MKKACRRRASTGRCTRNQNCFFQDALLDAYTLFGHRVAAGVENLVRQRRIAHCPRKHEPAHAQRHRGDCATMVRPVSLELTFDGFEPFAQVTFKNHP